jgi:molybdenum ABC transporter molybdate-binding protein
MNSGSRPARINAAFLLFPRSQALPGNALTRGSASLAPPPTVVPHPAEFRQAEPARLCVPRQSLGTRHSRSRPARINAAFLLFLGSVAVMGGLIALLAYTPKTQAPPGVEPLTVYCAAGLKAPVDAIAREYEQEFGVPIRLQYGGSNTLLANLEISHVGDLYLPADGSYIEMARGKDLLAEVIPVARMQTVLAVPKGNPKQIDSIDDLTSGDLRLAQANPDAAAVGKLTREALIASGHWDEINRRTKVFKPTVNDVAADVKVGTVDASFVWDITVEQMQPALEAVRLPELKDAVAEVQMTVLKTSQQPTAALRFARYLSARDKGQEVFRKHGFQASEGDAWAVEPQLRMFAGAMVRPAVDETITAFEEREGVKVTRVYNGCGILVAQMRAGEVPDGYFACDKSFMNQVHDLFLDSSDVSTNQLVILVHKGNPHEIKSLADLGKPGIKIGVGHEQQCALGVITQETLRQSSLQSQVMKNVAVQSPTGDMLVNQLRTGSLDAAVVYISNATYAGDAVEAIAITGIPCSVAVQPIAVGKASQHKQLMGRLLERIKSVESKDRFESFGFSWQVGR